MRVFDKLKIGKKRHFPAQPMDGVFRMLKPIFCSTKNRCFLFAFQNARIPVVYFAFVLQISGETDARNQSNYAKKGSVCVKSALYEFYTNPTC